MSRFSASEHDEMEASRRRHEAEERRDWEEDRRATDSMWREGEARRRQEKWDRSGTALQHREWRFTELREDNGRVSGWTAFLNGHKVGLVLSVRGDLVIITTGDDGGEADVHYVRGSKGVSPDANQIMAAFQQQLPAGAQR